MSGRRAFPVAVYGSPPTSSPDKCRSLELVQIYAAEQPRAYACKLLGSTSKSVSHFPTLSATTYVGDDPHSKWVCAGNEHLREVPLSGLETAVCSRFRSFQ